MHCGGESGHVDSQPWCLSVQPRSSAHARQASARTATDSEDTHMTASEYVARNTTVHIRPAPCADAKSRARQPLHMPRPHPERSARRMNHATEITAESLRRPGRTGSASARGIEHPAISGSRCDTDPPGPERTPDLDHEAADPAAAAESIASPRHPRSDPGSRNGGARYITVHDITNSVQATSVHRAPGYVMGKYSYHCTPLAQIGDYWRKACNVTGAR